MEKYYISEMENTQVCMIEVAMKSRIFSQMIVNQRLRILIISK